VIFVTVGTQIPFDRMVRAVDAWALERHRSDVFAQIGPTDYRPKHIEWVPFLDPNECREKLSQASTIVAHAGMGTILSALELGKPIVVMPRRALFHEHRSDHQVDTAHRFGDRVGVARDDRELHVLLDRLSDLSVSERIGATASARLLAAVRSFVSPAQARFDGVVCFGGEDWWYHNRGHYDMQMMRVLSDEMPVLYVNSIGMRMPSPAEGGMFLRRVGRKLASLSRGVQKVGPRFGVQSVLALPALHASSAQRRFLALQVRTAAKRLGIGAPALWVACPTAGSVIDDIPRAALIYQRTDRLECFPGVDRAQIRALDRKLKAAADLTLFCSSHLFEQERADCKSAALVDHGVDFERFAQAGTSAREPEDLAAIPRPRIGFVGGVDAHTFDPALFCDLAARLPDCHFVVVGGCSLPPGWCRRANVHVLGRRSYEQVPDYMAACDVLIMPWNRGEWIQACNPVKLKEYLAVGRPIVTTPFQELARYSGLVTVANDAAAFAEAIRTALARPFNPQPGRDRVQNQTWQRKAGAVLDELRRSGILAKESFGTFHG
jgi:UDP-N-acetylglucosamine transferase subunit ALG13/glycosyltransferase involved in cell wall biosynthesis